MEILRNNTTIHVSIKLEANDPGTPPSYKAQLPTPLPPAIALPPPVLDVHQEAVKTALLDVIAEAPMAKDVSKWPVDLVHVSTLVLPEL